MQSGIRSLRRSLRILAFALSFAVLLDQFAHAATPSHRLTAALERHAAIAAAVQPQETPAPQAQQPPAPIEQQGPAATLPPEAHARQRLVSAHTLYLAKSTQDANFPASPDDAYNLVLASLKNWGRYQIVDSVGQADLVLQLRDAVHSSVVDDSTDNGSTVYYSPAFQLTIADPSTLSPIWTVSSSIPASIRHKSQQQIVALSAQNLISQLKLLAGDSLTAQDQSALKQAQPRVHSRGAIIGLVVGLLAVAVVLPLVLFLHSKHNAEANQAAFCAAHDISPCPGA